ncbi:MAG: DUF4867 family protein [Sphaerochaetaceae bacterium]
MQTISYQVPTQLNLMNPTKKINSITCSRFKMYGRVLEKIDATKLIEVADKYITLSEQMGTQYVTSVEEFEITEGSDAFKTPFGGMEYEIGHCSGKNSTLNGMEYHKSPEIFVAVTDCLQFLTPYQSLDEFSSISTVNTELFYFPKGSVSIIHPLVLHLAPCSVYKEGFKSLIILPRFTNEPLTEAETKAKNESTDPESQLLLKKNKWIIAHPERIQLTSQGVPAGIQGENLMVNPI